MQEKIFEKVMHVAELAKLDRKERAAYEDSLKNYRDLQNVKDTYFMEGEAKGKLEGEAKGKLEGKLEGKIEAAIKARKEGIPIDLIVTIFEIEETKLLEIFKEHEV